MNPKYQALVSSDWNGCLAPCGPFDFISFAYPRLKSDLAAILNDAGDPEEGRESAARDTNPS